MQRQPYRHEKWVHPRLLHCDFPDGDFASLKKKKIYIYYCCVNDGRVHAPWYMYVSQSPLAVDTSFLLLLCRFWGLNSGLQACLANAFTH